MLDNHYDGKMINDFHNLTNEILDLEEKIKQITTSRKVLTDKEERNLTTEERGLIEKFNTEKDELLKKYDEKKIEAENFKNGNKSLYYIKQFLFGVNDYVLILFYRFVDFLLLFSYLISFSFLNKFFNFVT